MTGKILTAIVAMILILGPDRTIDDVVVSPVQTGIQVVYNIPAGNYSGVLKLPDPPGIPLHMTRLSRQP